MTLKDAYRAGFDAAKDAIAEHIRENKAAWAVEAEDVDELVDLMDEIDADVPSNLSEEDDE